MTLESSSSAWAVVEISGKVAVCSGIQYSLIPQRGGGEQLREVSES